MGCYLVESFIFTKQAGKNWIFWAAAWSRAQGKWKLPETIRRDRADFGPKLRVRLCRRGHALPEVPDRSRDCRREKGVDKDQGHAYYTQEMTLIIDPRSHSPGQSSFKVKQSPFSL